MVPGSHLLFPSGSVTPLVLCPIPPCIILDCTAIYILYMAKPSNPCQNHTLFIFYRHSYRWILSTSIDQLYSLPNVYSPISMSIVPKHIFAILAIHPWHPSLSSCCPLAHNEGPTMYNVITMYNIYIHCICIVCIVYQTFHFIMHRYIILLLHWQIQIKLTINPHILL